MGNRYLTWGNRYLTWGDRYLTWEGLGRLIGEI
jgi:hypothetical protein